MFEDKEFFIYAYLVLLRSMSNNTEVRDDLLKRIIYRESANVTGNVNLRPSEEIHLFMDKYGLNFEYLD